MTRVRLFAAAAEAAATEEVLVDADTIRELERELDERFGAEFARVRAQCSLMVDGVRADADASLRSAATVDVLPPFAGG